MPRENLNLTKNSSELDIEKKNTRNSTVEANCDYTLNKIQTKNGHSVTDDPPGLFCLTLFNKNKNTHTEMENMFCDCLPKLNHFLASLILKHIFAQLNVTCLIAIIVSR